MNDQAKRIEQYLHQVYHNTQGYRKKDRSKQKNDLSDTYGEILYPSIDKLLSMFPMTTDDVFLDLGSGLGKIVAQAFLKTPIKESRGIELVPELHQQAIRILERIQQDLPDFFLCNRKINFLHANFLTTPFTDATVILMTATCFSQAMLHAVGEIIEKTPSIRLVLSLRPIPTLYRLPFYQAIRVECSWDAAMCYVYCK